MSKNTFINDKEIKQIAIKLQQFPKQVPRATASALNRTLDYTATLTKKEVTKAATVASATDFLSWFKSVDLDSLQEGINSVSRVIGVLQDFGTKDTTSSNKVEYKPRPLYKHFED